MSASVAVPDRSSSTSPGRSADRSAVWWAVATGVFVLAFVVRIVPVLRGGGLFGLGNYDDAVHFASAVGLVHGQLPYRDFLLLQPPGIVLALAPFAALGGLIGDPWAWAIARVCWMAVGATTAVLVARLLRPQGLVAMITGGVCYALFFPAAYVDRTTILEGPQCLLWATALLLLSHRRPGSEHGSDQTRVRLPVHWPLLAGIALGYAVGIKIWGVAPLLVIMVWLLVTRRFRDLLWTTIGAAVCTGLVYGIFFVQAPAPMWEMVVTDQLGRRRTETTALRLLFQTGLSPYGLGRQMRPELIIMLVALAAVLALACRVAAMRVVAALYLVFTVILINTPSGFLHYAALIAVPTAVLVGSGVGQLVALVRGSGPLRLWRRGVLAVITVGLVAGAGVMAYPQTTYRWGTSFPHRQLEAATRGIPGCLSYDDPGPVLLLDRLRTNLDRGCPFVVDLGGRSYHPPMITNRSRRHNVLWQDYALSYLRSGEMAVVYRFRSGFGFSPSTAREVFGWPRVIKSGSITVLRPPR